MATMIYIPLLTLIIFIFIERLSAQIVGVDICACQPSIVTFRLNFTQDCTESNVLGPGINDTTCFVETRGSINVTDTVPISVSTVQVLELSETLAPVGETVFDVGYFDGDEITYTSIVELSPDNITAQNLPRGFQVVITGLNAAEQNIVNTLAIAYTGGKTPRQNISD